MTSSQSSNVTETLMKQMQELVPDAFKEGQLDVVALKNLLGTDATLRDESYGLNWLGKSYARLLANEKIRTWLKEDKEHNAKPENKASQNLLIKGDNLEVLKHLIGAYREEVKMIYIDPPYNTGSDGFVYEDDRKFSVEQLSSMAGIEEDEAKRILEFTQSKSNSHSAWLTFIYPRLYIARHLLRDDGVIFISIDDNEQAQLKLLCDEVFGEENFVGEIANINNPKGRSDDKYLATAHEYLLVYANSKSNLKWFGFQVTEKITKRYNKIDEFGKLYREIDLRKTGDNDRRIDRENLFYYFYYNETSKDLIPSREKLILEGYREIIPLKDNEIEGNWRWGLETAKQDISKLIARYMPNRKIWGVFEKDYLERRETIKSTTVWDFKDVNTERGTEQFMELGFEKEVFFKPKPVGTIKRTLQLATNDDSITLDFFAGSGTTSHAVMQLNAEDKGNRQFICVQMPELTDTKSEAYKAGYKTIFDITKARLEKAAAKIKAENPEYAGDLGFRIYETLAMPEKYQDAPEELTENLELFDVSKLDQADRHNLMRTWALHDNVPLTIDFTAVDLAGYKAYQAKHLLYFIEPNLTLDAVIKLLEQLDSDPEFKPSRLVVFGYLLDSKVQREMSEAVKHFNNRKGQLTLDVRY